VRGFHKLFILLMLLAVRLPAAGEGIGSDAAPGVRAADPVAAAEEYARAASVSADMALNALENAHADRNKAEQDLVAALMGWDRQKIGSSRSSLDAAEKGARQAMAMVEGVLACSARARRAAVSVREHVEAARNAQSSWRRRRSERRSAKGVEEAEKHAAVASSLCKELKARWLVPASMIGGPSAVAPDKAEPGEGSQ